MQAMTSRSITRRIHAASVSPSMCANRCTFACNRSDTAAPIFRSGMIGPNWSRRWGRPIMRIWPVCCDGDRESDCDGIGTRPRTQVTQLYRNKKARETQRANTHNHAVRPAGRDSLLTGHAWGGHRGNSGISARSFRLVTFSIWHWRR